MKNAAKLSSLVAKNYLIEEISHLIDEEKPITHEALTTNTDNCLFDQKLIKKLKIPTDVWITRNCSCSC
jgi:nucleosome binding factor SPN SPT16 subunit